MKSLFGFCHFIGTNEEELRGCHLFSSLVLLVEAPVVGTDGVGQLVVCGQNWGVKHSGTSVNVIS